MTDDNSISTDENTPAIHPFEKLVGYKRNNLKITFEFNVPDISVIGVRKHSILVTIWDYLKSCSCYSRSSIYDYILSTGKEMSYGELEEYLEYIKVERTFNDEDPTGFANEGGVSIKK